MQTAKTAAATAKESASNVAASAISGMDKTKATVQEKGEMLTANHPMEKDIATQRKQEKILEAEMHKREARAQNAAAAKGAVGGGGVMGSHPVGTNKGRGGNPLVGGGATNQGDGTGGGY